MKTPKPKKTKSGRWRIQLMVNGERYSCTGDTREEARDMAKQLYAGAMLEKRSPLTVGKAMDKYIEEKTGTLSPSTIRGYKAVRRNYFQKLMSINITDLTQSQIQSAVSLEAKNGKSPKTIRNAHGLLTAVLAEFRPSFVVRSRLPEKEKMEQRIFTEEEMQKVWNCAKGSKYELPILLASWLGLRMSEVRGLKYGDVKDGRIHIHAAVVRDSEGKSVEKRTKTVSGDRWITLPKPILELIRQQICEFPDSMADEVILDRYICPYADITIYKNFLKFCEKAEVEPCRFHDLRHFAASEALALGVPDKYASKRMGHKTDNMLKTVYQHTMEAKEKEFGDLIDERMNELYRDISPAKHE